MIISSFLPRENKKQLANNRKALRCFISLGKFWYATTFILSSKAKHGLRFTKTSIRAFMILLKQILFPVFPFSVYSCSSAVF